ELHALGLDSVHLALAARRLASARAAIEASRVELARTSLQIRRGACAVIDLEALKAAPAEIVLRLLQTAIQAFGGRSEGPERAKPEKLVQLIKAGERVALTLGGALIETKGKVGTSAARFQVFREPGRGGIATRRLRPGEGVFWDRRFYVSLSPAWS